MNDLKLLKEALTEKQFECEPLAFCIMLFLNDKFPDAYSEILQLFDGRMDKSFDLLINKLKSDQKESD